MSDEPVEGWAAPQIAHRELLSLRRIPLFKRGKLASVQNTPYHITLLRMPYGKNHIPDAAFPPLRKMRQLARQVDTMPLKDQKSMDLETNRSDALHEAVIEFLGLFGFTQDDEPWASYVWAVAFGSMDAGNLLRRLARLQNKDAAAAQAR